MRMLGCVDISFQPHKRGVLLPYGASQGRSLAHPLGHDAPLSPTSQTDTFASQIQHTSWA